MIATKILTCSITPCQICLIVLCTIFLSEIREVLNSVVHLPPEVLGKGSQNELNETGPNSTL